MGNTEEQSIWLFELDVTSDELKQRGCIAGLLYVGVYSSSAIEAQKQICKWLLIEKITLENVSECIPYSRHAAIERIGGDWKDLEKTLIGPGDTFEIWFGDIMGYESR